MHNHQHAPEDTIACRMAFAPELLARAVQRMHEEEVDLFGFSFEPNEDRGVARFRVRDRTNAMLVLEELGLEPRPGLDKG